MKRIYSLVFVIFLLCVTASMANGENSFPEQVRNILLDTNVKGQPSKASRISDLAKRFAKTNDDVANILEKIIDIGLNAGAKELEKDTARFAIDSCWKFANSSLRGKLNSLANNAQGSLKRKAIRSLVLSEDVEQMNLTENLLSYNKKMDERDRRIIYENIIRKIREIDKNKKEKARKIISILVEKALSEKDRGNFVLLDEFLSKQEHEYPTNKKRKERLKELLTDSPAIYKDYLKRKLDSGDSLKLINDFVRWRPYRIPAGAKNTRNITLLADAPNPHRKTILEKGHEIVPVVIEKYKKGNSSIPLSIIWILGEIGSPDAFDFLLKEYLTRPNQQTAISIGSCLSSFSVKKLFQVFQDNDKKTKDLVSVICGNKLWDKLKDKELKKIEEYVIEHFRDIKLQCMRRSIPQLG